MFEAWAEVVFLVSSLHAMQSKLPPSRVLHNLQVGRVQVSLILQVWTSGIILINKRFLVLLLYNNKEPEKRSLIII